MHMFIKTDRNSITRTRPVPGRNTITGFQKLELIAKIIAIILFALGVIRSFWNDAFVWVINGGVY